MNISLGQRINLRADSGSSSGTMWRCGPLPERGVSPGPQPLLSQGSVGAESPW